MTTNRDARRSTAMHLLQQWAWLLVVLVAIAVVIVDHTRRRGIEGETQRPAAERPATAVAPGKPALLEGIAYRVKRIATGNEIGLAKQRTQGIFVFVTVSVQNRTAQRRSLDGVSFLLHSRSGRFFEASARVGRFEGFGIATGALAPGVGRSGRIAFELPALDLAGVRLRVDDPTADHALDIHAGM